MDSGKLILGVLASFAVGATLGVLFAPDKGSSTRKKISKKRDDYVQEIGDKYNAFVETVTKKIDALKSDASHLVDNGKAKAEALEAKVSAAVNK